jgi:tetratricopeptide (TPR) repeat protein
VVDDLPVAIRNAIEGGNAVLFLGAGVGRYCRTPAGDPAPDGAQLAKALAGEFEIETTGEFGLPKVARLIELRRGRKELVTAVSSRLSDLDPDEHLQWLTTLTWKAIFTTNYDHAIERAYELNAEPPQVPVSVCRSSEIRDFHARVEVPIYHLHGCVAPRDTEALLITDEDYARFRDYRQMMFNIMKVSYATVPILYIGYSQDDPNWKTITHELRAEFAPATPPPSFRVAPFTDPADKEILLAEGVTTLDGSLDEFESLVRQELGDIKVDPTSLDQIESTLPPDLRPHFRATSAPVARLAKNWVYVNQAAYHKLPNTSAFLAGDHPNWALISQGIHFPRDVEEAFSEQLLDYATVENPGLRSIVLLAPAGYGITTALMSQAHRLVKEQAGAVLMHRRTQPLTAGDIELATSLFSGPIFLFVDNAADHADNLRMSISRLHDLHRGACLVFGERLNEWRQLRGRLRAREFGIEPLSDPEIERLLEFLEKHGHLKNLADLDHEKRMAVIRQKHKQELLVVMKEATEGKGFNAIIEDEFRGLENDESRSLYAATSCFYRSRALARDQVVAHVVNENLAELHRKTADSTEGVVIWESIDEERGVFAARTRHHKIAEIVWERTLEAGVKELIVQRSLEALNLNFYLDAKAFELFVRSDLIDAIRDLEGKIKFFEAAAKKDPNSPYVRQHYARMLRDEGLFDLALKQIDEAIEMAPQTRVLYHTKGLVLTDLALSLESLEIGRRRLAQAEGVLTQAISTSPRDEYSYHGLGSLYLGWARRVEDDEERALYLSRAEEAIAQGLRKVRQRESLYVLSSDIQQFVGDEPAAIRSLEKAIELHPESGIARFILARTRLRGGDPGAAIELLDPVLEKDPEDVRAATLYAHALDAAGSAYSTPAAILEQASLYGVKDPRFVATLGGMLFMNGQFSEAQEVFDNAISQEFTFEERLRVEFIPRGIDNPSEPLRLDGRVASVKAGYAFIEARGYPSFFCHSTKFGDVVMEPGKAVSFQPAFCVRGAVALDPSEPIGDS